MSSLSFLLSVSDASPLPTLQWLLQQHRPAASSLPSCPKSSTPPNPTLNTNHTLPTTSDVALPVSHLSRPSSRSSCVSLVTRSGNSSSLPHNLSTAEIRSAPLYSETTTPPLKYSETDHRDGYVERWMEKLYFRHAILIPSAITKRWCWEHRDAHTMQDAGTKHDGKKEEKKKKEENEKSGKEENVTARVQGPSTSSQPVPHDAHALLDPAATCFVTQLTPRCPLTRCTNHRSSTFSSTSSHPVVIPAFELPPLQRRTSKVEGLRQELITERLATVLHEVLETRTLKWSATKDVSGCGYIRGPRLAAQLR